MGQLGQLIHEKREHDSASSALWLHTHTHRWWGWWGGGGGDIFRLVIESNPSEVRSRADLGNLRGLKSSISVAEGGGRGVEVAPQRAVFSLLGLGLAGFKSDLEAT